MRTINILILIAALLGCAQPVENNQPEDMTDVLSEKWQGFIDAWESENAKACASFYSEDGINIGPDSPIRTGHQEIAEFYDFLFSNHQSSKYKHEILQLDRSGNHAFEIGKFTVNWVRNDSTKWTFQARSATHWVQNEAGDWKMQSVLFNQPPVPTPSVQLHQ